MWTAPEISVFRTMLKNTPKEGDQEPRVSDDAVVELAEMFRLMSDPTRLGIILTCLNRKVSVGDMAARLGLSPSLVSHHLRLLRAARLLQAQRQGRQVFYLVADPHVRGMLTDMIDHVEEDNGDLESP